MEEDPDVLYRLEIEVSREIDGRWLADVVNVPGAMDYGNGEDPRQDAVRRAVAIAIHAMDEARSSRPTGFDEFVAEQMRSPSFRREYVKARAELSTSEETTLSPEEDTSWRANEAKVTALEARFGRITDETKPWKATAEDGSVGYDLDGRAQVTFAADGDVEILIRPSLSRKRTRDPSSDRGCCETAYIEGQEQGFRHTQELIALRKLAETAKAVRHARPRGSPIMMDQLLDEMAVALDEISSTGDQTSTKIVREYLDSVRADASSDERERCAELAEQAAEEYLAAEQGGSPYSPYAALCDLARRVRSSKE
jgi:hypothetical protein